VSDRFADLRGEIDRVDERILTAVNERLRLVEELWRLKTELGIDRLDPGREQEIRAGLRAANPGPLTDAGVDELIDELLALTKREQRRRG
jgi:chorismate mutase